MFPIELEGRKATLAQEVSKNPGPSFLFCCPFGGYPILQDWNCLCNVLSACSRVSEEEEEKMKGKKFPLQRIWQNVAHITSIHTVAHIWLLQRLGWVVKLCGCMPIYNLGLGDVISTKDRRMVTGEPLFHKGILFNGFMGGGGVEIKQHLNSRRCSPHSTVSGK